MANRRWSVALLALALATGCQGRCPWKRGETWSFSITGAALEALDDLERDPHALDEDDPPKVSGDLELLLGYVAIAIAPVAADVVLLPVTGVHDLWLR